MKTPSSRMVHVHAASLCAVLFMSGSLTLTAQLAPPTSWDNTREAPSEASVRAQAAAAQPMNAQLAAMMRPLPEVRPEPGSSLYKKSIILFDGEMHTLVPVGSVLHLPPALRDRVIQEPKGDFTYWPGFLKRNSTWLAGKEVPLKMAEGDPELAVAVMKETAKSTQLLVSVYRQCPISILEPAPAAARPAVR